MRSLTRAEELAVRPEMNQRVELVLMARRLHPSTTIEFSFSTPDTSGNNYCLNDDAVTWQWSLSGDTLRLLGLEFTYRGGDLDSWAFTTVRLSSTLNRFKCRYMEFYKNPEKLGATLSVLPESETSERKLELRIPDTLFNYGLKKETENA